jgi:hypothetical protein
MAVTRRKVPGVKLLKSFPQAEVSRVMITARHTLLTMRRPSGKHESDDYH